MAQRTNKDRVFANLKIWQEENSKTISEDQRSVFPDFAEFLRRYPGQSTTKAFEGNRYEQEYSFGDTSTPFKEYLKENDYHIKYAPEPREHSHSQLRFASSFAHWKTLTKFVNTNRTVIDHASRYHFNAKFSKSNV